MATVRNPARDAVAFVAWDVPICATLAESRLTALACDAAGRPSKTPEWTCRHRRDLRFVRATSVVQAASACRP